MDVWSVVHPVAAQDGEDPETTNASGAKSLFVEVAQR